MLLSLTSNVSELAMLPGRRLGETADDSDTESRAAQYVRMSTEHQKYSTANQAAAIANYAALRGFTIVKTYEDAGRSGLRIEGREALKRLIADVQSRQTDFSTILVYDVKKLSQKTVRNPREAWIRYERAFDAIVDKNLFQAAQHIIDQRICHLTDADMLDRLRTLAQRQGTLSGPIIDAADDMPSSDAYRHRFGGLLRAFELAGHKSKRDYAYLQMRSISRGVVEETIKSIERLGGTVRYTDDSDLLTINDELTASIMVVYCYRAHTKARAARWKLRLRSKPKSDITIAVRMDETNAGVKDYLILPRVDFGDQILWLCPENKFEIDAYRYESLDPLIQLCARHTIGAVHD